MTSRRATRWVATPLLELGYLVIGLFAGVVTGAVAITCLALSIGLLPAFLLGIPVAALSILVVHGLAAMERARAAALLGVDLPGRPLRPVSTEPHSGDATGPWRLAWVVPPWRIGSGGHTTIFRLIRQMELRGHRCTIFVFDPYGRESGWVVCASSGLAGTS